MLANNSRFEGNTKSRLCLSPLNFETPPPFFFNSDSKEGERELFFHLYAFSGWFLLCALTRDQPRNLGILGQCWTIQSGPHTFYFSGSSPWAFVSLCVKGWSLVRLKYAPSGSSAVLRLEGPGVVQPEWVSWLSVDSQSEHISGLWVPIPCMKDNQAMFLSLLSPTLSMWRLVKNNFLKPRVCVGGLLYSLSSQC